MLDITARREAELSLAQRGSELERANEGLAQFAYVASPDLQEPLGGERGLFGSLGAGDRIFQPIGDCAHESGHEKIRLTRSVAVDDLLTYSRTINGEQQLQELDLRDEIESALNDLSHAVSENDAEIPIEVLHVWFTAGHTQFARLITNVVSNSIKYRKQDEAAKIRIKSSSTGNGAVLLEIADNGIGTDEKYAQTIFEPFKRLHSQPQYPGSGIGLAICESIADQHGSLLAMKSTPGEGTTFFVTI